jgi:hypothetical protein
MGILKLIDSGWIIENKGGFPSPYAFLWAVIVGDGTIMGQTKEPLNYLVGLLRRCKHPVYVLLVK